MRFWRSGCIEPAWPLPAGFAAGVSCVGGGLCSRTDLVDGFSCVVGEMVTDRPRTATDVFRDLALRHVLPCWVTEDSERLKLKVRDLLTVPAVLVWMRRERLALRRTIHAYPAVRSLVMVASRL
jgi:hypothetical protein